MSNAHETTPNRAVDVNGQHYAHRHFGKEADVRNAQLQAIAAWRAPSGGDCSNLKAIRQPVSIAHGSRGIMVPRIASPLLAQNLPTGSLSLHPDADHDAIFRYPNFSTEQVTRSLASSALITAEGRV